MRRVIIVTAEEMRERSARAPWCSIACAFFDVIMLIGEDILRAGRKFGDANASRGRYLPDDSLCKAKMGMPRRG